ncbi:contact-dependent growth inhibition system immunity protein [Streptomyces caatingaensis]|uniref:CdiI immunity protein domain-containing protein n=1 Tax=Streptomyces caatingaensis TaxID=1678637 RepID=A0A0K9XAF0_9ACTN|nr:contact-dependent growth inhibition system immunity protein [Streptomyces caatingaensis]KNB50158.1 hypothetical protein AC230_26040 [Streptomyces caatingaensis]
MSLKPIEHDRQYGELDQLLRFYLGQPADDTPEVRSAALDAYLREVWRTRPWAVSVAEQQVREYAENPPGRLRQRLGEFYALPDVGLEDSEVRDWLMAIAGHLRRSVEEGEVPPSAPPRTHGEWHARFPELGQLLGGWFSQDMPDEFGDHDAALADYAGSTEAALVARLVGEVHELLALRLAESDTVLAVAELGMEVEPPAPYSVSEWLAAVAERLGGAS